MIETYLVSSAFIRGPCSLQKGGKKDSEAVSELRRGAQTRSIPLVARLGGMGLVLVLGPQQIKDLWKRTPPRLEVQRCKSLLSVN